MWTNNLLAVIILSIWICGIASGVVTTLPCCHYVYHAETQYVYFDFNLAGANTYLIACAIVDGVIAMTIFMIYIACVFALRKWQRFYGLLPGPQIQRRKQIEINLLTQAFLITSLVIGINLAFIAA